MSRKLALGLIAYALTVAAVFGALYVWSEPATRHWLWIGAAVGALGIGICTLALSTLRYLWRFARPSSNAYPQPLQVTQVNASWIRAGHPIFSYAPYTASPDMHTGENGIWRCEGPASFDWHFEACDEVVYILSGAVEVEYLSRRFVLKPGDSATFFAHTQATWHVSGHVQKAYALYLPNFAVRCYRRLFTSIYSTPQRARAASLDVQSNL